MGKLEKWKTESTWILLIMIGLLLILNTARINTAHRADEQLLSLMERQVKVMVRTEERLKALEK